MLKKLYALQYPDNDQYKGCLVGLDYSTGAQPFPCHSIIGAWVEEMTENNLKALQTYAKQCDKKFTVVLLTIETKPVVTVDGKHLNS